MRARRACPAAQAASSPCARTARTGRAIMVAPRGHFLWQPTWAPDGTRFAYVDEPKRGPRRLWVARAGGGPYFLARPGPDYVAAAWSPDCRLFAYAVILPVGVPAPTTSGSFASPTGDASTS